MDLFAFGGAALGIIVALTQLASGAASFGAVFSIIFLSAEFFLPLRTLGSFFHTAMSGMAAANKMFKLLDTPEPAEGTMAVDPHRADIECIGAGYSYDGRRTALENVDIHIPQGGFVGIVGESGSGKSTLGNIISGSLSAYEGSVLIGGVDLREISSSSLKKTITYVPFASYLFEGTVRSNLILAKPNATDDELLEALRRCKLDGFVQARGGLDAPITPEGSNLSGGQRQRMAMARALLHDTPVYVLDEATSNIDAESEAAIIELVGELAATKTVIMITHRLAALKGADIIYVLDSGRVVESGTHAGLVARQGTYARLWEHQASLEAFTHAASETERVKRELHDIEIPGDRDEASDATPGLGKQAQRRSHLAVMLALVKLTKPLLPVMLLAIVLGVAGFAAAIFLTVFAAYGLLDLSAGFAGIGWVAACVAVAICGIVRGPLRYGEQLCNHYLAFKTLALVRDRLFAVMRKLAPAKMEGRNKGNLVSMITSDVELLEVFYAHTLSPIAIALLVSAGMTIFMAFLSPALAAFALFSYLVVGVGIPLVSSRASKSLGREVRDGIANLNVFVLDSLRGLPEILQFGRSRERAVQLTQSMAKLAEAEAPLKKRMAVSTALMGPVVMVLEMGMIGIAAYLVMSGSLGFAPALICIAALISSFGPVIAVANLGVSLQQTLASAERVLEILEEQPMTTDVHDGTNLRSFEGTRLADVDFSYEGNRVLDDVNLDVEPGSIVRIAGKSGAGKSTLLKLLMRFWDTDNGTVELSGHDIRSINTTSLRSNETFMAQDTFLFDGTIRDNLLIAKPSANDDELWDALQKASLAGTVLSLPQGLDTPIGELGDSLSGGERQRLGLARAFLHDTPLMLLDEPTSNLDSLNEAAIFKAIRDNRDGKTIVLVSHRPSAAGIADVSYSVERQGVCS